MITSAADHTTNIQSVGTSQLSQVEFFGELNILNFYAKPNALSFVIDSPPVWRVVGVLLTLVSDDEDKSYGLKIIRVSAPYQYIVQGLTRCLWIGVY